MHLLPRWRALLCAGVVTFATASLVAAPFLNTYDFPGRTHLGYKGFRTVQVYVGSPYRYAIQGSYDTTTYAVTGLPDGLSCDAATGVISGTPTVAGTFPLHITVSNASGSASAEVSLLVNPSPDSPPVIAQLTDQESHYIGYAGPDLGNYVSDLIIDATEQPTSYVASGLPPGAHFDPQNGFIEFDQNGLTAGLYHCDISATNAFGSGHTTFTWKVYPALYANGISIEKLSYVAGEQVKFAAQFTGPVVVTGAPKIDFEGGAAAYVSGSGTATLVFVFDSSTLHHTVQTTVPLGIDLNGGTIASPDGLTAFTAAPQARDTPLPDFMIWAPQISLDLVTATVGISAYIEEGEPQDSAHATYTVQAGVLPPGLSMDASNGTITGTPTTAGTYVVTLHAVNTLGVANTKDVTFKIAAAAPTAAPVVTPIRDNETFAHFETSPGYNSHGSFLVQATNSPTSFSATGLPSGVTLNAKTGEISYDANAIAAGVFNVTVTATNAVGSGSTTFRWTSHATVMPEGINPTADLFFTGQPITLTAEFNTGVTVTGTPAILLKNRTRKALYISGSGTNKLTFSYTPTYDDGGWTEGTPSSIELNGGTIGNDGAAADLVSAEIFPSGSPGGTKPIHVVGFSFGDVVKTGTVGVPFNAGASVGGESFTVISGSLPPGISLDGLGNLMGTPTTAGIYSALVRGVNYAGFAYDATMQITILPAPGSQPPTDTPPPSTPPTADNPPPPTTPPPADNPPPVRTKTDQTITFSSPVSAIIVGQPITLGATSSVGLPITYTLVSGDATISGNTLTPNSTATLIVRASSAGSSTVNAASVDVNFGNPQKTGQGIKLSTSGGAVPAEKPIALSATTDSGLPVTYTVVTGPATISGNTLTFTGTGNVTVRASQAGDGTHAAASDVTLTFTATPVSRLVNLSSRVHVAAGDASHGAIAGFVVTGDQPKQILVRAVGPTLAAFGITTGVPAPHLQLFDGKSNVIASNSGWNNDAQIAASGKGVGAFGLRADSKDAAVLVTLAPGIYTAQVQSDADGMVLIEVYDVSANAAVPTKQLINISTRGVVGMDDNVLVAGFVVAGNQPKRVLIRAVGPSLGAFGVSGIVADPVLKLYDAHNVVLARNDDWEMTTVGDVLPLTTSGADIIAADKATGAFALAAGSKDAALVVTLPPGQYSAIVSGANNTTGAAIVEVYELP